MPSGLRAVRVQDGQGREGLVLMARTARSRSDLSGLHDHEPINLESSRTGLFARRRPWVLAIVALILLGVAWLNMKPAASNEEWGTIPYGEDAPDAYLEGFHLVSSVRGSKQWELYAQSAKMYQKNKEAYAEQIYVEYFRNGRIVSTLTADRGVINTQSNDTFAEGHVELITENGAKLETSKLQWDSKNQSIHTGERVHIYKGLDDITALGMSADARLDTIRFMKDVRTRVRDTKEIENFSHKKRF